KVRSPWSIALLSGVYAVEDAAAAMAVAARLAAHESVVTRDGVWFGQSWVRISKTQDESEGILQRRQLLEEIQLTLAARQSALETEEEHLTQGREVLTAHEQERDIKQRELTEISSQNGKAQAQLSARQAHLAQARKHEAAILQQSAEQNNAL